MSIPSPPHMSIPDLEELLPGCYSASSPVTGQQKEENHETAISRESGDHSPAVREHGNHSSLSNKYNLNDYTPMTKENNLSDYTPQTMGEGPSNHTPVTKENHHLDLMPVPPCTKGEGLPYAPVDWPNPGDVWSWRVGKRANSSGFFQDRFLYLPKHLQKHNSPKSFASMLTLQRYVEGEFSGVDVNALFSSFSWKIPALLEPLSKGEVTFPSQELPPDVRGETDTYEESKNESRRAGLRKRTQNNAVESALPISEETPPAGKNKKQREATSGSRSQNKKKTKEGTAARRQTRQRVKQSVPSAANDSDNSYLDKFTTAEVKNTSDFEGDQDFGLHIYVSPENGIITSCHPPVEMVAEEFDNYLNSLDDILAQPVSEGPLPQRAIIDMSNPQEEMAEARYKLSSLLNMDFTSLICSSYLNEVTDLASKLQKDPTLSAEQLVKLKLIEEMPSYSEVFLENKEVMEQADKFFTAHEVNKSKVTSLRKEYNELKDRISQVQSELDSSSLTVQDIDRQIAELKSRRTELTRIIESKKKDKLELTYNQKLVANSIPKVVNEVQQANSKRSEWELKKENALKREDEILAKFAPLKGFLL